MLNQELTYLQPYTHQTFQTYCPFPYILRTKTHGYVPDNAENKLVYLRTFH